MTKRDEALRERKINATNNIISNRLHDYAYARGWDDEQNTD